MLIQADISKPLPIHDETFHCIVTSPPYAGGLRDYDIDSSSIWGGERDCVHNFYPSVNCTKCGAWKGQLGQEPTPEAYANHLVWALEEPMRTLRYDGVLFLNLGDMYRSDGNKAFVPHLVAMLMQDKGYIVKQDIIWAKAVSFNKDWSGSVMPEPVNGWRWERHMIPSDTEEVREYNEKLKEVSKERGTSQHRIYLTERPELMVACPGCEKCEPDGYILKKSQWRPTCSHEYIFMIAKSDKYFCDREAVREGTVDGGYKRNLRSIWTFEDNGWEEASVRDMKSVMSANTGNYKGKHYAAFSGDLVEPLLKVATSEKGVCPECGNQWARVVNRQSLDRTQIPVGHPAHRPRDYGGKYETLHGDGTGQRYSSTETLTWSPTCNCGTLVDSGALEPIPAIVFDPFMGTGTTGLVARALGLRWVGTDIGMDYLIQAQERTLIAAFKRFEEGIDGTDTDLSDLPMFMESTHE